MVNHSRRRYLTVTGALVLILLAAGAIQFFSADAPEGYNYMQRCLDGTGNQAFCTSLEANGRLADRCHEENRPGTPLHCHWDGPVRHEH